MATRVYADCPTHGEGLIRERVWIPVEQVREHMHLEYPLSGQPTAIVEACPIGGVDCTVRLRRVNIPRKSTASCDSQCLAARGAKAYCSCRCLGRCHGARVCQCS